VNRRSTAEYQQSNIYLSRDSPIHQGKKNPHGELSGEAWRMNPLPVAATSATLLAALVAALTTVATLA
jgi:hypothetical protein